MSRIPIIWRAAFFWLLFAGMVAMTWAKYGRERALEAALIGLAFGVCGLLVLISIQAVARARAVRARTK